MNAKLYNQGSKGDFNYFSGGNYEQSDYTDYGTSDSRLNMIGDCRGIERCSISDRS